MQKIRGAALLAATALAVSGLAACGDEGEPTDASSTASPSAPEKSSTTQASASESESSAAGGSTDEGEVAELPEAAKKRTKAGAVAFNEFYWEEAGKALHSGNPEVFDVYSDGCVVCDEVADGVRSDAKKGIHMNKNPYSVSKSSGSARADSGYRVELTVNVAEYHEVLKNGSKGRTAKKLSMTVVSDTRWEGGHWIIKDQVRIK